MSDFQKPSKPRPPQQPLREFGAIGAPEDFQAPETSHRQFGGQEMAMEMTPEEEEQLRQARREKMNPPINPQAKTRVEMLADIGKLTKEVPINDHTFTLRTLKSREQKAVYLSLVDATNRVDEAYNLKLYSLAHSLSHIDGQSVEMMVGKKTLQEKLSILEELEESTTDRLWTAFQELKASSESQFAVKTDEDVQEVREALKK